LREMNSMPNWPGYEKAAVGMKNVRSQSLQVLGRVGQETEELRDGGVGPCPYLGPVVRTW
jgi:hypothetical protein